MGVLVNVDFEHDFVLDTVHIWGPDMLLVLFVAGQVAQPQQPPLMEGPFLDLGAKQTLIGLHLILEEFIRADRLRPGENHPLGIPLLHLGNQMFPLGILHRILTRLLLHIAQLLALENVEGELAVLLQMRGALVNQLHLRLGFAEDSALPKIPVHSLILLVQLFLLYLGKMVLNFNFLLLELEAELGLETPEILGHHLILAARVFAADAENNKVSLLVHEIRELVRAHVPLFTLENLLVLLDLLLRRDVLFRGQVGFFRRERFLLPKKEHNVVVQTLVVLEELRVLFTEGLEGELVVNTLEVLEKL